MDWALDAFNWLAPDLVAELLAALGGAALVAFLKNHRMIPCKKNAVDI